MLGCYSVVVQGCVKQRQNPLNLAAQNSETQLYSVIIFILIILLLILILHRLEPKAMRISYRKSKYKGYFL
jgi:uncharacterized integral membrane protein